MTLMNGAVEATILMGGGHMQSLVSLDPRAARLNPLWEPPWPTVDPSLRRLAAETGVVEPDQLEGELLASIGGCNLCCDVFGSHSAGEAAQGLAYHGEAGVTTWEVERWDIATGTLTLVAELRWARKRRSLARMPMCGGSMCTACRRDRATGRARRPVPLFTSQSTPWRSCGPEGCP